MKPFEELVAMTDSEREAYLHAEVEKVIEAAAPAHRLKLRALQARIDKIKRTIANPVARRAKIESMFWDSLFEFRDALTVLQQIETGPRLKAV